MGLTSAASLTSHNLLHSTMKVTLFLVSALEASSYAAPQNVLTCSICVDVVTDVDNAITDDTTINQLLDIIHTVCGAAGAVFGETVKAECNAMFDEHLANIINSLVNDNLNPQEVCTLIKACP